MKIQQVKLKSLTKLTDHMVCWVPTDEYKLKVGMILELRGVNGLWAIEEIFSTTMDHFEVFKRWNVGGL